MFIVTQTAGCCCCFCCPSQAPRVSHQSMSYYAVTQRPSPGRRRRRSTVKLPANHHRFIINLFSSLSLAGLLFITCFCHISLKVGQLRMVARDILDGHSVLAHGNCDLIEEVWKKLLITVYAHGEIYYHQAHTLVVTVFSLEFLAS